MEGSWAARARTRRCVSRRCARSRPASRCCCGSCPARRTDRAPRRARCGRPTRASAAARSSCSWSRGCRRRASRSSASHRSAGVGVAGRIARLRAALGAALSSRTSRRSWRRSVATRRGRCWRGHFRRASRTSDSSPRTCAAPRCSTRCASGVYPRDSHAGTDARRAGDRRAHARRDRAADPRGARRGAARARGPVGGRGRRRLRRAVDPVCGMRSSSPRTRCSPAGARSAGRAVARRGSRVPDDPFAPLRQRLGARQPAGGRRVRLRLVLAAGGSSRSAGPSSCCPFGGATLLEHVLATARECASTSWWSRSAGRPTRSGPRVDLRGAEVVRQRAVRGGLLVLGRGLDGRDRPALRRACGAARRPAGRDAGGGARAARRPWRRRRSRSAVTTTVAVTRSRSPARSSASSRSCTATRRCGSGPTAGRRRRGRCRSPGGCRSTSTPGRDYEAVLAAAATP